MGALQPDPRQVVEQHEASLDDAHRRITGAHYTPGPLATRLVGLAVTEFMGVSARPPESVCDPSCGAGSILLALADALVDLGVRPEVALDSIWGFDLDDSAVAIATDALASWARIHGVDDPAELHVELRDGLGDPPEGTRFDLIAGNPPFASPLDTDVAARRRAAGTLDSQMAYTDEAALHLLAAVRWLADGGVAVMLQPQSVLGSRDAYEVRASAQALAELRALWATDEILFDRAVVHVCAPVMRRRSVEREPGVAISEESAPVEVHWRDDEPVRVAMDASKSWAPLLSVGMGNPIATGSVGVTAKLVGELAVCTAGFRDEFYALAQCVRERGPGEAAQPGRNSRQVMTSGLIDPGTSRWATKRCRIGGRYYDAPVVDLDEVGEISPRVARWSAERSVPKLLVASQTRVLEVCVDRSGTMLPLTPVVSVEPRSGCDLEALAALLSAPTVSLEVATRAAGTGLSATSLRIGAARVRALRVPSAGRAMASAAILWRRLEALAAQGGTPERWNELGRDLDRLSGHHDPEVVSWWVERLPRSVIVERT